MKDHKICVLRFDESVEETHFKIGKKNSIYQLMSMADIIMLII